jgi:hypothetical protein
MVGDALHSYETYQFKNTASGGFLAAGKLRRRHARHGFTEKLYRSRTEAAGVRFLKYAAQPICHPEHRKPRFVRLAMLKDLRLFLLIWP